MDPAATNADDSEQDGVPVRVDSLHVYPVKSCAGISLAEATLAETGFDLDRTWMVVDADGRFVTQRELPRMALVQTALKGDELVLRAPGMLALHVAVERVESPLAATVWRDTVPAWDMGRLCAQWFSDFLGRPLRLVRFDPEAPRRADPAWTGGVDVPYAFQDGFPLLVASTASLDEVNRRLAAAGEPAVTMARFRPNIVLDGLGAHEEDHLDEIVFQTGGAGGEIVVRLVKPCARCAIPDVDPATGSAGHAVGDVLQQYRADARLAGALTFAMNGLVVEGTDDPAAADRALRVGMRGAARYAFD